MSSPSTMFSLTGASVDHARRDGFLEGLSKVTHDGRIAGVFGQAQHQLDLTPTADCRRQQLCAPGVLVADDVLEQQRGAAQGKLARVIAPISSSQSTETVMRRNWSAASSVATSCADRDLCPGRSAGLCSWFPAGLCSYSLRSPQRVGAS